MANYEFKLPDIGEGIAEAEIVAWHVKLGDTVAEDQQIADMMTDKATVEMESPVAGKVIKLAGEVGDQIAIGSVLVVIETEGEAHPHEHPPKVLETHEVPLADGAVEATEAQEEKIPVTATESTLPHAGGEEPRSGEGEGLSTPAPSSETNHPPESGRGEHVLASPAVRQRARDLGIDLAQVKTASDRVRHSDLDAYLLYNGGTVAPRGRSAALRPDESIKVVGLRRKIAENMQEA
jgi:2-oxoisovalerate dehydrogenase E2 component (dihydrolipoyl transacylase)